MNISFSEIEQEVKEHLNLKRFKLALITSKKLVETFPANPESYVLYSFSLLENLNPFDALETVNYAVEISSNSPEIRLQRARILYRLSINDGALVDCNFSLSKLNQINIDDLLLKVKILAANERFFEALELIEEINSQFPDNNNLNLLFTLIKTSLDILAGSVNLIKDSNYFIELCKLANEQELYWFVNFVYKNLINKISDLEIQNKLKLLNLIALVSSFKLKEAEEFANDLKDSFFNNADYIEATDKIQTIKKFRSSDSKPFSLRKVISQTELVKSSDSDVKLLSAKFFDLTDSIDSGKRKYLLQFDENNITYIAIELLLINPYFKKENYTVHGTAIWFMNDFEVGRNNFQIELKSDWEIIEFVQSWGTELPGFWKSGEGKVEIILNDKIICSRKFLIGESEILNFETTEEKFLNEKLIKSKTAQPPEVERYTYHKSEKVSLETLLNELYEFIGLDNLKQSIIDFLTYLNFIGERRKKGIKTDEKLELHCLFLGNPGTGKTSVARLFGKILRAMGVLENGHVIEVDRAGLVGQYIGETAIKTDKIISEALGGILFIDEAYSLKKANTSSDFGQEAIDILLKRMEDYKGKFIVIAAGYPSLMNEFIESNPGLKSRFTHTFNFDDYTPEQLIQIFKLFASKEEYELDNSAEEFLLKQLNEIYKTRDDSFGNARLIRKIFNETKIQLSKRYQSVDESEKEKFSLNKIRIDDIKNSLAKIDGFSFSKNNDTNSLNLILERINKLVGLENFKRESYEIVKLARYYAEEGELLSEKFNFHFLFAGRNYAGQSIAAKYLAEIFYLLGITSRNDFYEYDVRQFFSNDIFHTVEKTNNIFDKVKGGVLLIKDFDFIFKDKFTNREILSEFVNTFYNRLQKDSGKTIVIIDCSISFPDNISNEFNFIKTFFSKKIIFDDYTPDELLEIFTSMLYDKKLSLADESKELLRKFFFHVYRNKEKYPPNTLLLKNILDIIQRKHLLRISDIPRERRTEEISKTIRVEDIADIIELEKSRETNTSDEYSTSIRKYLDELDLLAGLNEVKQTILRIINSERVAELRRERGLNVVPRNLHGLFVGTTGTGKTTVAKIYSNILFELGLINNRTPLELDKLTIKNLFLNESYLSPESLLKHYEGKLVILNHAYQFISSDDSFVKEFFNTTLGLLKIFGDRFVLILSDSSNELNLVMENYSEYKKYFTNTFNFKNFTPREMLEIALNFTQQYGYQLDEGAWQLLLEIFNDLYSRNNENGCTKVVLDLIYRAITNQEMRLSKQQTVTDEELTTITIDDIAKLI